MGNFSKILAVMLVIAAVLLGSYAWMLSRRAPVVQRPMAQNSTTQASAQYPVVIAAKALEAGQPIRAESLAVKSLSNRPAGAYGQVEGLIGQVPMVRIEAGAPITAGSLANGVALQLQPGERAIAVSVDELSAVGHRVQPGDHVDVFMTMKPEQNRLATGEEPAPSEARLVASDLRVLGYGTTTIGDAARKAQAEQDAAAQAKANGESTTQASANSSRNDPNARTPATAVLAVPVDQINTLALATQSGKLVLALRNPKDATVADTSLFPQPATVLAARADLDATQKEALADPANRAFAGLDLPNLSGSSDSLKANKPVVKKARAAHEGRTLEVIRGDKRSSVSY